VGRCYSFSQRKDSLVRWLGFRKSVKIRPLQNFAKIGSKKKKNKKDDVNALVGDSIIDCDGWSLYVLDSETKYIFVVTRKQDVACKEWQWWQCAFVSTQKKYRIAPSGSAQCGSPFCTCIGQCTC
jgi:hypothetical protein